MGQAASHGLRSHAALDHLANQFRIGLAHLGSQFAKLLSLIVVQPNRGNRNTSVYTSKSPY
jgi:hypothetical protein